MCRGDALSFEVSHQTRFKMALHTVYFVVARRFPTGVVRIHNMARVAEARLARDFDHGEAEDPQGSQSEQHLLAPAHSPYRVCHPCQLAYHGCEDRGKSKSYPHNQPE
jgi:hypothetical protein